MVHLRTATVNPHAQTPGVENPTTIMGGDKITIAMKLMWTLKATIIAMKLMWTLKATIIAMKLMWTPKATIIAIKGFQGAMTMMSNLTAPMTIKSNRIMTIVITHLMITMLEENIVSQFGT